MQPADRSISRDSKYVTAPHVKGFEHLPFVGALLLIGISWSATLPLSMFHAVAYTGYVWLVGKAGAVFSSHVAYVVTLSAMALSAIFLGEAYSPYALTSLALMIGGLMLVQPPLTSKSKS
jgi:drug/metabolite transporter (DMT)-like permease